MQLKLQRSQRAGGVIGKTVVFCLDARADYSPAEAKDISKYNLGSQVIYNSQAARKHLETGGRQLDRLDSDRLRDRVSGIALGAASLALAKLQLNISIASLGRGHHIECKDLPELLGAEEALMEACRNLKQFLDAAATFNGSIILVDFDDGEKVHVAQGSLELQALPPATSGTPTENAAAYERVEADPREDHFGESAPLRSTYERHPQLVAVGGAAAAALFILFVFGIHLLSLLISASVVATAYIWTRRA